MEEWCRAFKLIHGVSPSKEDFDLAPAQIRKELIAKTSIRNPLKRKLRAIVHLTKPDEDITVTSWKPKLIRRCQANTSTSIDEIITSPIKNDLFSNEFGEQLLRRSPRKRTGSILPSTFSPQKPTLLCRTNVCRNIGNLINQVAQNDGECTREDLTVSKDDPFLTMDELRDKKTDVIVRDEDQSCDEAARSSAAQNTSPVDENSEPINAICNASVPKKKTYTRKKSSRSSSKRKDTNFVKLNIRKKVFVRGHRNAQMKRKMWRRLKFGRKSART
ncbi:hypothetical protein AB6A40_010494 [Gnathostoma spinigerum]|uniref:Uncharacterized protein n=1 Tax=Gnathostoma spinigerum TaxID=75299 RepID=A0ABD6EWB5_9BILA